MEQLNEIKANIVVFITNLFKTTLNSVNNILLMERKETNLRFRILE
ncbi:hypothetical protein MXB_978 [Myxobolus squamalis]|nr:hypothetical protein MXB_978 [Myxobolus squamalis]